MPGLGSCPPDPTFPWARCACGAPMRSDGLGCTGAPRHPVTAPTVQVYATWTGTRVNLTAMHTGGLRLIAGPDQLHRYGPTALPPLAWALDNGAWSAHRAGRPFNGEQFLQALLRWGHDADWVVLPDVVAGGLPSLVLSLQWRPQVAKVARLMLLPVQDGMEASDVAPHVGPGCGIFVGGSTEWKWRTLPTWGALAARAGAYLHVGRVNSARGIRKCAEVGAHSCDGTSATTYSVNAAPLAQASRELARPMLGLWK